MAVLGYASRWRHGSHRFFPWAAERVPPFYIWHQTVIVLVALPVIAWIANPVLGFGVIALVLLVATLALTELSRLTAVTRMLSGMKPR